MFLSVRRLFPNAYRTKFIDLRSDTVTKPSAKMRELMANAEVGDDVFKEDPTVNELERRCAELCGMEAASFVPTGTMGNLIAIMVHCDQRGSEIIVGSRQHIHKYEQGGYAQIAGVSSTLLPNNEDGTLDLNLVEKAVRVDSDFHQPKSRLLCLENTHMLCGGRVLSNDYLRKAKELAKRYDVAIHMDGARLLNAAVASGLEPKHILKHVDSVSICFSKGLGCPIGSIICGSSKFIDKAVRTRKVLGGGMRQVGVLAATAQHALDNYVANLSRDHKNAQLLASAINDLKVRCLRVKLKEVETNIVFVNTDPVPASRIVDELHQPDEENIGVLAMALDRYLIRFVTHCDINDSDIPTVVNRLNQAIRKVAPKNL